MFKDRDKQDKEQDQDLKGVPQGTHDISNSRNGDDMKGAMRQQQCIEFVKAQEEETHGPGINPTCPYIKDEEAMVKANTKDDQAKQSTTVHEDGQACKEKMKDVPPAVIVTSNSKEDNITKIKGTMINSNMRAYYERGQSGKHTMWSSEEPKCEHILEEGTTSRQSRYSDGA